MNNGKICVTIGAKTANELFEQLRRIEDVADIVEVRFDFLDPPEVETALENIVSSKPLLITCRSKSQGGTIPDNSPGREAFWKRATAKIADRPGRFLVDNELDLISRIKWPAETLVVASHHDFNGIPDGISGLYKSLSETGIAKIAVNANNITDAIPVWKLLETARKENKPYIPIAMGEAGKWTRILGLAHGAFMTYAATSTGEEAAPGQISVTDMVDVFRVRELNRDTEVFGIVAGNSSYSISPWMHNAAFKTAGMNRVFIPLQVADLDAFIRRMVRQETREVELNFKGFSVTNPHKQSIMRHLDKIDKTASKIGAVNTVKIENGQLFGYNTDAAGFILPLKKAVGDLRDARVSIVGAGGAARACIYSLLSEGASVTLHARDRAKASALVDEFNIAVEDIQQTTRRFNADILINATPLGTKGETERQSIAVAEQLKNVKLVYDLVYNPLETLLIHAAKSAGVPAIGGLEMLIAQGARQFEIWTGNNAPTDKMADAVRKKLGL